jgi:hypothetical protein
MSIQSTKALHSRLYTVVGEDLSDVEMEAISGGKHEFKHAVKTASKAVTNAAHDVEKGLKNFFD